MSEAKRHAEIDPVSGERKKENTKQKQKDDVLSALNSVIERRRSAECND